MSVYDIEARQALREQSAFRAEQEAAFRARVLKLVAEGLTDTAVALRMGCGKNRVANLRREAGLGRNPVAWSGMM